MFEKSPDDLVRLAMFTQALEAYALKGALAANGINSVVSGETASQTLGTSGFGLGGLMGISILVRRADLTDARLVLKEIPEASDAIFDAWNCPCGAEVDQGFSVCWSCGKDHPDVTG